MTAKNLDIDPITICLFGSRQDLRRVFLDPITHICGPLSFEFPQKCHIPLSSGR